MCIKYISSFLFIFLMGSEICLAQKSMKKGDEYFNDKAYAVAAIHYKKDAEEVVLSKLKWARCQYMMKEVKKCTDIYATAPADSLKDIDRYYYADALWQIGNKNLSREVGGRIVNPIMKDVIMNLSEGGDTLEVYSQNNVEVKKLELEPNGNSFGAYWYKGQLYYVASSKKVSLIDEVSANDSATFLDIKHQGGGDGDLPMKKINTTRHEGSVTVSPANDRIVITRTVNKGLFKSIERPQLFELRMKKNGKWSKPKHIEFCDYKFSYAHASFSQDGKSIYFASDVAGGKGGFDIYSAQLTNDVWDKPAILQGQVNTSYDELFPTMAMGNLFFSSNRSGGMGAFDIYGLEKESKTVFHLPDPINSSRDDFSMTNNGNDSVWFVSSNRNFNVGKDEILQLNYPEIKDVLFVSDKETGRTIKSKEAYVKSNNGNLEFSGIDARGAVPPFLADGDSIFVHGYYPHAIKYAQSKGILKIFRRHSKNELQPIHEILMDMAIPKEIEEVAGDKVYQIRNLHSELKKVAPLSAGNNLSTVLPFDLIQEGDTIEVAVFKQDTLLATAVKIVTKNNIFRANEVKVSNTEWKGDVFLKKEEKQKGRKTNLIKSLKSIYFATNKWFISPAAKKELNEVVKYMKENPEIVIECAAHADCRSSREYNLKLSENRAKASADYIVRQGVKRDRVKHKGYGEDFPVNGCICEGEVKAQCDSKQLAANRRTEFIILSNGEGTAYHGSAKK
jgi:outer membrane protein OmpA-like peptidoglycan-associated protein